MEMIKAENSLPSEKALLPTISLIWNALFVHSSFS